MHGHISQGPVTRVDAGWDLDFRPGLQQKRANLAVPGIIELQRAGAIDFNAALA